MRSLLLLAATLSFMASPASAQEHGEREDGHDAAHDAGHEVHNMETMHVDYDAGNRPEAGEHNGGGGSSSRASNSAPAAPKIVGYITLGPTTFTVNATQAAKVAAIVKEYRDDMVATNVVSAIAVAFQVFQLASLNSVVPAFDAFLKALTTNPDQLIDALTVQTPLAQTQRAKTVSEIDKIISNSPNSDEAKMWRALRDLFAHPERYRGGGIKIDPATNQVILKEESGANLRSIAGAKLSKDDVLCLRFLTSEMMTYGPSRDYVMQSDYAFDLKFGQLTQLTRRDELILNRALMAAGPNTKMMLVTRFANFARTPSLNQGFWRKMSRFLYTQRWEENEDGWIDPLAAFERDDDLPEVSDVATTAPYLYPGPLSW